jgi:hypothetical protein
VRPEGAPRAVTMLNDAASVFSAIWNEQMTNQLSDPPSNVKTNGTAAPSWARKYAVKKFDFLEALRSMKDHAGRPKLSDLEYRLISEILQHTNGLGRTYRRLSDEQLAVGIGHPWRSLRKARFRLRDMGYLTWERTYRTRNTYQVHFHDAEVRRALEAKRAAITALESESMALGSASSQEPLSPLNDERPANTELKSESMALGSANGDGAGERHLMALGSATLTPTDSPLREGTPIIEQGSTGKEEMVIEEPANRGLQPLKPATQPPQEVEHGAQPPAPPRPSLPINLLGEGSRPDLRRRRRVNGHAP